MDSALWGLLGTIVGALASIGTAWLATRASARLEREKVRLERVSRDREFQQQTLIELQDAVCEAIRQVTSAHFEDMRAYQEGRAWGQNMLSKEVDEDNLRTRRRVLVLTERVSDDQVRVSVAALMEESTKVLLARTAEDSQTALQVVATKTLQALKEIGTAFRSQYESSK